MSIPTITPDRRLFCSFRLAGTLYGVDVLDVKEINTETTFTPIPQAPAAVCGHVNLRGQIHLILDLRQLLGLPRLVPGPNSRLVIFKPVVGEAFGVVVDEIGDIVSLENADIEPRRQVEAGPVADLLPNVGKCGAELLLIVAPRRLLKMIEGLIV